MFEHRRHTPPALLPLDDHREVLDRLGLGEVGVDANGHDLAGLDLTGSDHSCDLRTADVIRITGGNGRVLRLGAVDLNLGRGRLRVRRIVRAACRTEQHGRGQATQDGAEPLPTHPQQLRRSVARMGGAVHAKAGGTSATSRGFRLSQAACESRRSTNVEPAWARFDDVDSTPQR